jgi:hypothetical protein
MPERFGPSAHRNIAQVRRPIGLPQMRQIGRPLSVFSSTTGLASRLGLDAARATTRISSAVRPTVSNIFSIFMWKTNHPATPSWLSNELLDCSVSQSDGCRVGCIANFGVVVAWGERPSPTKQRCHSNQQAAGINADNGCIVLRAGENILGSRSKRIMPRVAGRAQSDVSANADVATEFVGERPLTQQAIHWHRQTAQREQEWLQPRLSANRR